MIIKLQKAVAFITQAFSGRHIFEDAPDIYFIRFKLADSFIQVFDQGVVYSEFAAILRERLKNEGAFCS